MDPATLVGIGALALAIAASAGSSASSDTSGSSWAPGASGAGTPQPEYTDPTQGNQPMPSPGDTPQSAQSAAGGSVTVGNDGAGGYMTAETGNPSSTPAGKAAASAATGAALDAAAVSAAAAAGLAGAPAAFGVGAYGLMFGSPKTTTKDQAATLQSMGPAIGAVW